MDIKSGIQLAIFLKRVKKEQPICSSTPIHIIIWDVL
jgi:hypothetical protein